MSTCRYCEASIKWHHVAGRPKPLNADGSPHYCQSAKRRVRDVNHIPGEPMRGANYNPTECEQSCSALPWDHCPCHPST